MKNIFVTGFAVVAIFACVAVAQSTADLPSAPSAVQQQQNAPAQVQQPQPPAPPQAQPVPQSAPATPPQQAVQPATQPAVSPAEADPKPAATASNTAPAASNPTIPNKQDEAGYTVETIKKRVDEVNVIFTVTDKHGHFIKNLTKDDFTVLDDHKPPASVVSFRAETDLPLRVGLLIDASNSIRDRFKFEQEASIEFLNQTVRPGRDKAFVIGFDTTAEVTADYTDNSEKLAKGIRVLRPGGGTALFDALYYACRDKLGSLQEKSPVRRAIVLISDGEDNQSRVTREEAIEMAQRAEVIIYAISTNVSNMKLRGDKILERLAEATGGRVYFPMKIEEVADYFNQIQEELRSQYAVAYKPANFLPDGRFRPIEIAAQNHKGLKVRARQGYYAPTQ